jgi:hypothetical protein
VDKNQRTSLNFAKLVLALYNIRYKITSGFVILYDDPQTAYYNLDARVLNMAAEVYCGVIALIPRYLGNLSTLGPLPSYFLLERCCLMELENLV